jgi:enamine deaminase RidA (YjgF/YER057c/UK114 family)
MLAVRPAPGSAAWRARERGIRNLGYRRKTESMTRIIRTEPNKILAKAVEYHGFVYVQGCTAKDLAKDIKGQTMETLAQIDTILETHGTDKTQLLQTQIWLKDIRDRDAMNEVWSAWLPEGGAPARACVQANMADPRILVEIMVTTTK